MHRARTRTAAVAVVLTMTMAVASAAWAAPVISAGAQSRAEAAVAERAAAQAAARAAAAERAARLAQSLDARSSSLQASWTAFRSNQLVAGLAGVDAAVAPVHEALEASPNASEELRAQAAAAVDAAHRAAVGVRVAAAGLGVLTDIDELEAAGQTYDEAVAALPPRAEELVAAQQAWQEEQDRIARERAAAEAAAKAAREAAAAAKRSSSGTVKRSGGGGSVHVQAATGGTTAAADAGPGEAPAPAAAPPAAPSYRAEAEAFLRTLPGGGGARIEWGDPQGHLGGVWMPGSSTIILNAARLDGRLDRTKDVLRHEIAHVHQNWTMASTGTSLSAYRARLDEIFGGNGIEKSADAVALLLGASSVRYQSSFTAEQYEAARAILAHRVP
ncbi:hypothetical protein [Xylanimonas oleitrophica]|uniref:hypothetical protein n=1 Tax=Xylanimonas oleitrophica TaxID=2607479 RepID=UPI0011B8368C|nr:hypothetical protein [Xylanimonas oleitrophica]